MAVIKLAFVLFIFSSTSYGAEQNVAKLPGESISMVCASPPGHSPFTPIEWHKIQDPDQWNMGGASILYANGNTLKDPFNTNDLRHNQPTLVESGSGGNEVTTSTITITDLKPEDMGKYQCIISNVPVEEFRLFVREAPTSIRLTGHNTDIHMNNSDSSASTLNMKADSSNNYLECVVEGGIGDGQDTSLPIPKLDVYKGDTSNKITPYLGSAESNCELQGATVGLQTLHCTVTRSGKLSSGTIESSDDGVEIICEATVGDGIDPVRASKTIAVSGPPFFDTDNCEATQDARSGASEFSIVCRYRSNPMASSVQWMYNGQTFTPASGSDNYEAANVLMGTNEYDARLTITTVGEDAFGQYSLTVTNENGPATTTITLAKVDDGSQISDGGNSADSIHLSYMCWSLLIGVFVYILS